MTPDLLEQKLGHRFAQPELLLRAVTHRSHGSIHNERLEFVGDGVLNCAIASDLYRRFPELREGKLSRLRASLVRQETLAEIGRQLALGDHLRLGEGEVRSGGAQRPSMLADALEALFGAIFLDAGYEAAAACIARLFEPLLAGLKPEASGRDPKTALQELLQGRRLELPKYVLCGTRGEAHAQEFDVECLIPELDIRCLGSGLSRRTAEQAAARLALEQVQAR
jgi:ribonuclease III